MAFEDLLVSLVSNLDDKGFKELDRLETKAQHKTDALSRNLKHLFVGAIGTMGVKEIVSASVKLDTLKKSMSALAGSDISGAEQISYLRKETQRLGQDFVTASNAYKNLFSAGVGTGMDGQQIQDIFSSVLEAGTVLGSTEQQMQGALMALEQMISKGKVSMEELRKQLGNALPGAMQIAARAMHTTSKGLQEMLESGLDSKKFVIAFANQLHYEFADKAVKASHTLRAELARLNNALFEVKTSFLDGDAGEAFADTIRQLVVVLNSPELRGSLQGISKFITFLLENIKPIMTILALLLGNIAVGKAAKGIGGIVNFAKGGLKLGANLITLTKGVKWLPRIWKIIELAWWALSPIKKIEAGIWLIVSIIGGVVALLKIIAKVKEDQKKKKSPNWQMTDDGKYTDVNPNSIQFMKLAPAYTDADMYKALQFGNDPGFRVKPKVHYSQYGGYDDIRGNKRNVEVNGTTINITTKSDNPRGIGEAVKTAMLEIFDSVRVDRGYPKTEIV